MTIVTKGQSAQFAPRFSQPATHHAERLALPLPIDHRLVIEGALIQALWHVRKHALPQATGHAIKAARLLKLACADAKDLV